MLKIEYAATELFDESNSSFIEIPGGTVWLEHSLVSISKWEMKYHKSFLSTSEKTQDELMYYIRCMGSVLGHEDILDENLGVMLAMTATYLEKIKAYLEDPLTATTVKNPPGKQSNKIVTSEVIYSWLVAHQIDFQVQYWPLPRLIKLVEVCNANNQPNKKMSKAETMSRHRALNAARRGKKP